MSAAPLKIFILIFFQTVHVLLFLCHARGFDIIVSFNSLTTGTSKEQTMVFFVHEPQ